MKLKWTHVDLKKYSLHPTQLIKTSPPKQIEIFKTESAPTTPCWISCACSAGQSAQHVNGVGSDWDESELDLSLLEEDMTQQGFLKDIPKPESIFNIQMSEFCLNSSLNR